MINELYDLTKAMEQAGVRTQRWHRMLLPLPNVSEKAPCVRILLCEDGSAELSSISAENATMLRRYGNKHGLFPATNLVPLYRITDAKQKEQLQQIFKGKAEVPSVDVIRSWCTQDNWNAKFLDKFAISTQKRPAELEELLSAVQPEPAVLRFIREARPRLAPESFRAILEAAVFCLLERRTEMILALRVLFHLGSESKMPENDSGTLSVVLDSQKMHDDGMPLDGMEFLLDFNRALLEVESRGAKMANGATDAFGKPYVPLDEPMPEVKLSGFSAILRTMSDNEPSQYRYSQIKDGSYPISREMRSKLRDALEWLSAPKHRDITWTSFSKDILFAYPSRLPKVPGSLTKMFRNQTDRTKGFEQDAKEFIALFQPNDEKTTENHTDRIQFFVIHKVDRGRSKIVYTHNTMPQQVYEQSCLWAEGCRNQPPIAWWKYSVLYPLQTAEIVNRIWKQDGTLASDKFKPIPVYRGLELFFGNAELTERMLHILVKNTAVIAPYAGMLSAVRQMREEMPPYFLYQLGQAVSLLSLLLFRLDCRKEIFMDQLPYLYGQLLKLSDELHALYCLVERKGAVPPQLAGSGFYMAAQDAPQRTLGQLGQRMNPYINWARFYQYKDVQTEKKESWRCRWLLSLYEKTADALYHAPLNARFTDEEKAQFFLGYLASLPETARTKTTENDQGGEHDEH